MKNNLIIKILLLIILPFTGFTQQDSIVTLSLSGAQEYALNNNLSLKNTKLDIDAAKKKVWETTAIGLPQANGALNYQHIPGIIPAFEMMDPSTGETTSIPLGVQNSTTYSLTVTQLVFSGEYIVGLQASKTYLQISKLSNEKQILDLKGDIFNSYISILILENNLEIIKSSIKNIESLLNETVQLYEKGFLESTDVDQLQISYNTLINSKNSIQRQVDISYMLFKILIGTDLDNQIVLSEDLHNIYDQFISKIDIKNFDLNNNIDYKIMDNQLEISELSLKREKTKYLPTISAFYTYQDKTNKASFDFTINHIIGAQIGVPLFSSFQRNAVVQQAKIEFEKSLNNKVLLGKNLLTQAQQLKFNYKNALEKYKVTNQNVELSENVFYNTSKKYKEGMVSSMDLTQANNTYLQSQSDNTTALFELFQNKIELEKILNEL